MVDYIQTGLFLILVSTLFWLSGCTEPVDTSPLEARISELEQSLASAEAEVVQLEEQVIVLEEDNDYLEKRLISAVAREKDLGDDFVEVHKNFMNCYFASQYAFDYEGFVEYWKEEDFGINGLGDFYSTNCLWNGLDDWNYYWGVRKLYEDGPV